MNMLKSDLGMSMDLCHYENITIAQGCCLVCRLILYVSWAKGATENDLPKIGKDMCICVQEQTNMWR